MSPLTANKLRFKVFLVEDHEDSRVVLMKLLQIFGYTVHVADTMQAALRCFPLSCSEVLLSDIELPDGNGWELLRALRRAGESPYAIAMSGLSSAADFASSKEAGFRHHLVKPIDLNALERLLEGAREEIEGPR